MSLEDAMELVFFAFQNARGGDIFVQKSPASTIYDLALALKEIFNAKNEIRVIGTRHGEKKHETLLSREERIRSDDLGGYYRIASDARDLNYGIYFTEGEKEVSELDDYNSFNTTRLNVPQTIDLLLKLPIVQEELKH